MLVLVNDNPFDTHKVAPVGWKHIAEEAREREYEPVILVPLAQWGLTSWAIAQGQRYRETLGFLGRPGESIQVDVQMFESKDALQLITPESRESKLLSSSPMEIIESRIVEKVLSNPGAALALVGEIQRLRRLARWIVEEGEKAAKQLGETKKSFQSRDIELARQRLETVAREARNGLKVPPERGLR